eukprot:389596_1
MGNAWHHSKKKSHHISSKVTKATTIINKMCIDLGKCVNGNNYSFKSLLIIFICSIIIMTYISIIHTDRDRYDDELHEYTNNTSDVIDMMMKRQCSINPIDINNGTMISIQLTGTINLRKKDVRQRFVKHKPTLISVTNYTYYSHKCSKIPIGIILMKIARCGSTLLTDLLEYVPTLKLIEEPHIISNVLKNSGINPIQNLQTAFDWLSYATNSQQKATFINLMSQNIYGIKHIRDAIGPNVPIIYLTRSVDQVFRSLIAHSPRWLSKYDSNKTIAAEKYIKFALNLVLKYAKTDTNFYVYDYADVVSLELPRFISNISISDMDNNIYNIWKWRLHIHSKTGQYLTNNWHDYSFKTATKTEIDLLYSETNMKFRIDFPYENRLIERAIQVKERDTFDRLREPFVIRKIINESNTLKSIYDLYSLNINLFNKNKKLTMLETKTQPLRFMWYNKSINCANNYIRSTKWTNGTFVEWLTQNNWYIQIICPEKLWNKIIPKNNNIKFINNHSIHSNIASMHVSHIGTVTSLYWEELSDTVLIQIYGTKRVLLFPPDTFPIYPKNHCLWKLSVINLDSIHPDMWNQINISNLQVIDINAGDVLYLPHKWGHWILSITDSVSLRRSYRVFTKTQNKYTTANHKEIEICEKRKNWANGYFESSINK